MAQHGEAPSPKKRASRTSLGSAAWVRLRINYQEPASPLILPDGELFSFSSVLRVMGQVAAPWAPGHIATLTSPSMYRMFAPPGRELNMRFCPERSTSAQVTRSLTASAISSLSSRSYTHSGLMSRSTQVQLRLTITARAAVEAGVQRMVPKKENSKKKSKFLTLSSNNPHAVIQNTSTPIIHTIQRGVTFTPCVNVTPPDFLVRLSKPLQSC